MLHELLIALLGHPGGVFKDKGDGLKVQSDLPFLSSADEKQLNYLCSLGTYYSKISNFIQKHGNWLCPTNPNEKPQGLHGLYLKALCCGLDKALEGYRNRILELEKIIIRDPHISVSHLVCHLQEYQLLFPTLVAITDQVTSHEAHGCYILDIIHRHSEIGNPLVKEVLTGVLHVCHGVMYQHLIGWLLYGYTYDPYKEFFIQPSEGQNPDQSAQSRDDDEDDLGIMGVTGRQLEKLLRLNVIDSSLQTSHLFMVKSELLPGYIPVRVANMILFVGESIQMFQDREKSPTRKKRSVLKGKEDEFASALHELAKQPVFKCMDFEALINTIRTHVAEQLWQMLVQDADLIGHLRIIKDFYLLGRGELFLAFIDQAHHILRVPVAATTEHDVNAAFMQAARNVLYHDESLLQRFRLTVDNAPKPKKGDSTSSSSSSNQSTAPDPAWNSVALKYTVEWPLHIFFTPNVLEKYNKTFRFLLIVRRTQLDLQQCWTVQKNMKDRPADRAEAMKQQLRTHMSFLIDNLQYYLQVDVIESQYGILVDKINSTRDYEAVKVAHDQFLSSLLAQSFVHMKTVAYCLYEILGQCSAFSQLVGRCDTPMSTRDTTQLETIAKNFQRQSSLLFRMLSSVRSNSSSPHLAQLLLRLDFNKYFSVSGGQFGSY